MHKRNSGYILLGLLVITGFGSQVYNVTISQKERTFLHSDLKATKKQFLESVKGLSESQLVFKPSEDAWSVYDCIIHLALSEEKIWEMADQALKLPANPEKRSVIKRTDEELMAMAKDRSKKGKAPEVLQPAKSEWKNSSDAVRSFKERRATLMKYVKTTTHDMRNHVVETMAMDSYQVLLLISAHTNRHTQQIREIRSHPNFPKD